MLNIFIQLIIRYRFFTLHKINVTNIILIKYIQNFFLIIFDALYNRNKFKNKFTIDNVLTRQTLKSMKYKKIIKIDFNTDSDNVIDINATENEDFKT